MAATQLLDLGIKLLTPHLGSPGHEHPAICLLSLLQHKHTVMVMDSLKLEY